MKTGKLTVISGDAAQRAARCPNCGAAITLQATVEEFGVPAAWHFYGQTGERWIRCRGQQAGRHYIHFVTLLDGRYSNRLAWLERPPAAVTAEQMGLL